MIEFFTLFTAGDILLILLVWAFIVAAIIMLVHMGSEDYPYEDDH